MTDQRVDGSGVGPEVVAEDTPGDDNRGDVVEPMEPIMEQPQIETEQMEPSEQPPEAETPEKKVEATAPKARHACHLCGTTFAWPQGLDRHLLRAKGRGGKCPVYRRGDKGATPAKKKTRESESDNREDEPMDQGSDDEEDDFGAGDRRSETPQSTFGRDQGLPFTPRSIRPTLGQNPFSMPPSQFATPFTPQRNNTPNLWKSIVAQAPVTPGQSFLAPHPQLRYSPVPFGYGASADEAVLPIETIHRGFVEDQGLGKRVSIVPENMKIRPAAEMVPAEAALSVPRRKWAPTKFVEDAGLGKRVSIIPDSVLGRLAANGGEGSLP